MGKIFSYRAINTKGIIVEGRVESRDFSSLALSLREEQRQIIQAIVSPGTNLAENRLEKMYSRVTPAKHCLPKPPIHKLIRLIRLLFS